MRTVTASEAKQSFASVVEWASKEPVLVQRQKRNVAVILSMDEYERLANFNVSEFQRFCDEVGSQAQQAGLTEAGLNQLLADD